MVLCKPNLAMCGVPTVLQYSKHQKQRQNKEKHERRNENKEKKCHFFILSFLFFAYKQRVDDEEEPFDTITWLPQIKLKQIS